MLVIILLASIALSTEGGNVPFKTAVSDLAELLKSNHFIDKTDVVKAFFLSKHFKLMVTAPRGFGKSTNLDIIKRFCEINVDENGNRIDKSQTENYKLFAENNLKIYNYSRHFFDNNFGLYPVIYLDFKKIDYSDFDTFLTTFRDCIFGTFRSHSYLLNSGMLDENKTKELNRYHNRTHVDNLDKVYFLRSLNFLSDALTTHFDGRKCIVLIDNYDWHLQVAIFQSCKDLQLIDRYLLRVVLNLLHGNDHVGGAFITGCICMKPFWTQVSIAQHVPFTYDDIFSKLYGFTQEEVIYLLDKFNLLGTLEEVKRWYNGYGIEVEQTGEYSVRYRNITIYNPLSVVNYVAYKKFDRYWSDPCHVNAIKSLLLHKYIRKIINVVMKSSTKSTVVYHVQLTIKDIIKLRKMIKQTSLWDYKQSEVELFMELMIDIGYFVVTEIKQDDCIRVMIPNLEIAQEVIGWIN